MKLTEIINNMDQDGFVIINEGVGSASVARVRELVAKARGIAQALDDKAEAKFRKELNSKLAAFNSAANNGNIRKIDAKAAVVASVIAKYEAKV